MKPYYRDKYATIYHGDCREILPELEPVDLVLTDPPYGIGENNKRNMSRGKLAQPTNYSEFNWDVKISNDLMFSVTRMAKNSIIWGGNYYPFEPTAAWLVWDKEQTGDFADCELAWTNLKQAARLFRHQWNGMIRASERGMPRVHPTQKPLALMKWCLNFPITLKAHIILDPFMGSGTTLVAAKELHRKAIGIEIEEKYCEIAVKRLAQEVLEYE